MPEPAPPSRKRRSIPSFSEGVSSPKGQASEDGKICAPCMIRGARAAKRPLLGKIFARCIPKRLFAGLFGCMARISCQSQPVFGCMACESCRELAIFPSEAPSGMHEAKKLPRMAARERTVAESCHGKALGNAPREYIATASQAKSASGRSPATAGRWETHFASILPSSSARGTHIRNVLPTERHLRAGGPIALP